MTEGLATRAGSYLLSKADKLLNPDLLYRISVPLIISSILLAILFPAYSGVTTVTACLGILAVLLFFISIIADGYNESALK